jgi:lipopolysaccharide/colanic/teichoic acid biosynthesis glycosyltransferase
MYILLKSFFDKVFALLFILVFSPLFLFISIFIFIIMGKGVFFKQLRVGENGKIFLMYKFRTMLNDDGKLSDIERTTKLGYILRKYSLDELPEFINILLGHMSFVGPRPLLVEYLNYYSPIQFTRHNVKPGLTGLAQIKGRNRINWVNKFRYDVFYTNKISFNFDMYILLNTFKIVFFAENVNANTEETMKKFKGNV